ncbi:MAG: ATP-binding protein [Rhodocyclaceae bacterium]|nr:ATP-binding protein [Rhodocyclaceae bacterium]
MPLEMKIGLDAITSYKRLAYTPWHALAEFVDNSTQSYFDNKEALDAAFAKDGEILEVSIAYEKDVGELRISDNSIGMSLADLEHGLHVALPPKNTDGRSKYGMGLKTAACWLGNAWTIKTKKLGETVEHHVTINVEKIAAGEGSLEYSAIEGRSPDKHFTLIEISDMNRKFHGRTLGKIRDFLSSMYREDFRAKRLKLLWNGTTLDWVDLDDRLLRAVDGTVYKKNFLFDVEDKQVKGWVGILDKGGRADAGFSVIHCGRVVRGWPDNWRPSSLYGQLQVSNDLVNQRLVGEIHLDGFEVSHTKDDILWLGDQEEQVEKKLLEHCSDYRQTALDRRKGDDDERGPSETETNVAIDELKKELTSPEMVDVIELEAVPAPDIVDSQAQTITDSIVGFEPTFFTAIGVLVVKGFLRSDMSPNDPYVTHDSTHGEQLSIIINQCHPHWKQLKGSDGVLNYLRHCVYDGIAEWQANHKAGALTPNTIKYLKDRLLRVPFEIEMNTDEGQ